MEKLSLNLPKWGAQSPSGRSHWQEKGSEVAPEDYFSTAGSLTGLPSGFAQALVGTGKRVLDAQEKGNLSATDAKACLDELDELAHGLDDLQKGDAKITRATVFPGGNTRMFTLQTRDKDEYVITTRTRADERGQARIAVCQRVDDGHDLAREDQVNMRLDLDQTYGLALDVQFMAPDVDARVHGVLLDSAGQPVMHQHGGYVVEHHFTEGLDPALKDPETFASMVEGFVKGTMAVLPQTSRFARGV